VPGVFRGAFKSLATRECALARRYNRILSLLMVDSGHLKQKNDIHGHEAGDKLIKHIIGSIRSALRTTDVAARCTPARRRAGTA
jgi:diguanylate cyclase (GGDEF)-like protein